MECFVIFYAPASKDWGISYSGVCLYVCPSDSVFSELTGNLKI